MQGKEFEGAAQALRNGDLDAAGLPAHERLLLEFALFSLFVRLADTFGIEPPAEYEPDGIPGALTREL